MGLVTVVMVILYLRVGHFVLESEYKALVMKDVLIHKPHIQSIMELTEGNKDKYSVQREKREGERERGREMERGRKGRERGKEGEGGRGGRRG